MSSTKCVEDSNLQPPKHLKHLWSGVLDGDMVIDCGDEGVFAENYDVCQPELAKEFRYGMIGGIFAMLFIGSLIVCVTELLRDRRKTASHNRRSGGAKTVTRRQATPRKVAKITLPKPNFDENNAEVNEVDKRADKEYGFEETPGDAVDAFKPMWAMPDPTLDEDTQQRAIAIFERAIYDEDFENDMEEMTSFVVGRGVDADPTLNGRARHKYMTREQIEHDVRTCLRMPSCATVLRTVNSTPELVPSSEPVYCSAPGTLHENLKRISQQFAKSEEETTAEANLVTRVSQTTPSLESALQSTQLASLAKTRGSSTVKRTSSKMAGNTTKL